MRFAFWQKSYSQLNLKFTILTWSLQLSFIDDTLSTIMQFVTEDSIIMRLAHYPGDSQDIQSDANLLLTTYRLSAIIIFHCPNSLIKVTGLSK